MRRRVDLARPLAPKGRDRVWACRAARGGVHISALRPTSTARNRRMSDDQHDHGQTPPSDIALRVKALESLMVEKGLVDPAALDAIVDHFEHRVGPRNGAR